MADMNRFPATPALQRDMNELDSSQQEEGWARLLVDGGPAMSEGCCCGVGCFFGGRFTGRGGAKTEAPKVRGLEE